MTLDQRIAQRFGTDALTHLAQRCPDPTVRTEFAEACLLWDTPPSASWQRDPFIPTEMT